jgi:hypothetical protein
MPPRRSALVLTLAACSLAAVAGCSSADPEAGSAPEAEVTGSAVPVADELTALCAQIVSQALPLDAATALAEASGYGARVASIDGAEQPAAADSRDDRMNFTVTADVVTECAVG